MNHLDSLVFQVGLGLGILLLGLGLVFSGLGLGLLFSGLGLVFSGLGLVSSGLGLGLLFSGLGLVSSGLGLVSSGLGLGLLFSVLGLAFSGLGLVFSGLGLDGTGVVNITHCCPQRVGVDAGRVPAGGRGLRLETGTNHLRRSQACPRRHLLHAKPRQIHTIVILITGRIAAKRQTAGIKFTHRPKIRSFAPQGRLVALIHVKRGRADEHLGPLGCAKFYLNRYRGWECGPQNIENFHFSVKSRPAGATPLTDF